jgi:IrrE N-terminal-like domain
MRKPSWMEVQAHRDWAVREGEKYAQVFDCTNYPIDPLRIVAQEPAIHAEGADLGDALDGRLKYLGMPKHGSQRYLLAYNTKYDTQWTYDGDHHPKVRFTIAHELGHYFLDQHRSYLQHGGQAYSCFTETYSGIMMEIEADAFAAGMLMPSKLMRPIINRDCSDLPSLKDIRQVAGDFQVSLTSTMVRWTRLSDFPCAVFSVGKTSGGVGIRWGWVSDAFANVGAYWRRYGEFLSRDARKFLEMGPGFSKWRSGQGLGLMKNWVVTDQNICVAEHYAVIPYAQHLLVFLTASEDDLSRYDH